MYDIIYIGGGLNYAGAIMAAKKGLKVALIEKDMKQLGGVCLHKGCIPSKMLLHYALTAHQSKNPMFEGSISLNMKTLVAKKDKLIASATKAVTSQCKDIDLIEGEGIIKEAYKVSVKDRVYEAKHIVIGTGSSPYIPKGIDYDAQNIITSDEVLNLQKLPKEICIYGVGAIGLEMASFFASNGVKVRLLSRGEGLQKKAHALIQKEMKTQLEYMDIHLLQNHNIIKAVSKSNEVIISLENQDDIHTPMLLVCSGRKPNLSVIQTKEIKIEKGITTNEYFESSLKDHYAIGDCNAKLQLAHAARAEVINVTQKILGKRVPVLDLSTVVQFIHTLPMSVASIGQTPSDTQDLCEGVVKLNAFSASNFHEAKNGVMIVYTDKDKKIVGAEILAPDAEELIAPIAMALAGEMDTGLASKTIMAHPSFAEALERVYFRI
ncbi:NAD(P)/FAD-dependent oxidoreductase [Sulfurimonas sp. MAG313]|nr:NAD(P)/FAD-dependent oxidoreductase [Sulfurimonas sp. MAG313]MDF1880913.1 NAD(P)/FAD-dependent oxidoreductase [Sulfurimonas sp. MAG313]